MTREDRFSEIENLMDRAIESSMKRSVFDFDRRSPESDDAHRVLVDSMWAFADGKTEIEKVKENFKCWLATLKVNLFEAVLNGQPSGNFSLLRKCFSIGCPGLVKFENGRGLCLKCNLSQVVIRLDGRFSEAICESKICLVGEGSEQLKVISLATYRKNRKVNGSVKRESGMSLF